MSRVAGFTVLMLGLGFGGYVYYPELAQYDADARNAAARLVKEDPLVVPASAPRETRTFSPQTPLFAPVSGPPPAAVASTGASNGAPVKPAATPGSAVATVQAKTEAAGEPTAWAATVTPASGDGGVPRLSSRPRDDLSREKLARELQLELKRVGCYQGEVDGQWGAGSRRAMTAFTERVNATLPVEEPDYILLTLVQGHQAAACGKACPAGQVMSSDRCVPQAVVAQAERKAKRTAKAQVPADTGRVAQPPAITRTAEVERQPIREPRRAEDALPGRMSIGGPAVPVLKSEPRRATPPPSRMADARPEPGVSSSGGVVPASPVPVTGRATAAPVPAAPAAREAQSVERHSRPARAPVRQETRVVRHAPEPRYVQRPSASSKSKRMIYDLFQRPDRVY